MTLCILHPSQGIGGNHVWWSFFYHVGVRLQILLLMPQLTHMSHSWFDWYESIFTVLLLYASAHWVPLLLMFWCH